VVPQGGVVAYLLLGSPAPPTPLPPHGLLRLAPGAITFAGRFVPPGTREFVLDVPLTPTIAPADAAFQLAVLDVPNRTASLLGLDVVVVTDH